MTVRESGILASLSFSRGKALVQGHDSPSFLWKEVPRRGGGWLTQRNKEQWARSIFSYRHPERSRGIFVAAALLFPLLIRLHEAPCPSNAWSIRLPVFVHTHTPFHRKRKRFLACARNDGTGKRYSRSASFPRGKALVRGKVGSRSGIKRNGEGAFSHIAFPSTAEGTLLQSASSPALLIRLHETPYPTFMEYQASRFRSHAYTV